MDAQILEKDGSQSGKFSSCVVRNVNKIRNLPPMSKKKTLSCDYAPYCKDEADQVIYLGQDGHLSDSIHPLANFPSGWKQIRNLFKGLCFYSGKTKKKALCNNVSGDSEWKSPNTSQSYFCGKVKSICDNSLVCRKC